MLAVDGFARGEKNAWIAKKLRVSVRSVERWRRSWHEGGRQAMRPSGPAKRPKIGDSDDFAQAALEQVRAGSRGQCDRQSLYGDEVRGRHQIRDG
ncbi:helix-turn-helix domain-containing protein [Streptomyces sp. NPDC001759]